jgi:photosystem II stability/assembly factor-like uncharacterized protein
MKKLFGSLIFSLFLLSYQLSPAQWVQVGYMITNGNDTAAFDHGFDAFGTKVYCGTDDGLFVSNDNGDSWQNITAGKPNTDGHDFYAAFEALNGDLFAGSSTRLFKSTDNGSNWSWVNALPDSMEWMDVTEIGGNLLASFVGSSSGVYFSADGGTSWNLATGISSNVRYFWVDGTTVFLGGGANGVYKSTDNGQSWAVSGTGFPASPGIWSVVKEGNSHFANSVSGAGLFVSRDQGQTWANTDTSVFQGFCQVFSITAAQGMILATMDGACNQSAPIKMSNDDGMSWTAFMDSLPLGYHPSVGRNAAGTSFFTKRTGTFSSKKVFRYDLTPTALSPGEEMGTIRIHPNPATGSVAVTVENWPMKGLTMKVMDITGRELLELAISDRVILLETSLLPRGIHMYQFWQAGRVVQSGKFVVN